MRKYLIMTFAMIFLVVGNAMAANTNSILLNGTSQYLSISDSAQSGLDITGDMTIELWMNAASFSAANQNVLISKWAEGISYQRGAYQLKTDGTKLFFATSTGSAGYEVSVSWAASTNVWYHVAVVYSASAGSATFYVNGIQQGSVQTGLSNSIYNNSIPLFIGACWNSSNAPIRFFHGKLDEVRITSRAKTAAEIAVDYKSETPSDTTGLVTNWKFNILLSGVGTYTNTMTNNGGATFSSDIPSTVVTETATPVTETPVTVTPTASNPITTVINQGVAAGLSIGTNQQYLIVGKDANNAYHLAIAETTGTFIKSVSLTSGYIPVSVTQVISGGTASTTQVSVLSTNAGKYYNLLVNTSTGAITPVAW